VGSLLRADGIALSTNGLTWAKGVGAYGVGWGNTGTGITVRRGGTLYIKYHSGVEGAALYYTEHGRKWDGWRTMGPVIADGIGSHPNEPVILKISDAGTPGSTVAWINGVGKSGIWSGLTSPGPYDLALHGDAQWTLPPIVVKEAAKPLSFWSNPIGWTNPSPPAPTNPVHAVPDGGWAAVLFAFAVLILAGVHRRSY
jgi:hypothetical protein